MWNMTLIIWTIQSLWFRPQYFIKNSIKSNFISVQSVYIQSRPDRLNLRKFGPNRTNFAHFGSVFQFHFGFAHPYSRSFSQPQSTRSIVCVQHLQLLQSSVCQFQYELHTLTVYNFHFQPDSSLVKPSSRGPKYIRQVSNKMVYKELIF